MTAPIAKARALTPVSCEIGGHGGNFSIYRARPGDKWGCAACVTKAFGGVPKWLRTGRVG